MWPKGVMVTIRGGSELLLMADICFHIHYIDAHGLSPFETQYGLVTLIILRFPKEFL
jgi:hypothetical protein